MNKPSNSVFSDSDEGTEKEVLLPTIEDHESDGLSDYLRNLVQEHHLPRHIAFVLNHLTSPKLQEEAATRFLALQRSLAWQIVRESLHHSSKSSSHLFRRPLTWLLIAFLIISAWMGSLHWQSVLRVLHKDPGPTQPQSNIPTGHTPPNPAGVQPIRSTLKTTTPSPEKPRDLPVLTPSRLQVHFVSRKEAVLSWKDLGPGYTYTVYACLDLSTNYPQKKRAHLTVNTYPIHWQGFIRQRYWLMVTATNPQGRESPMSEMVRVP